jgi:4-amino-4-deoxy-L-arabinose transferase-like glycosyltransferase
MASVRRQPGVRNQTTIRPPVRFRAYALAFALVAAFLILVHGPLLAFPFYWDEIGQFVPASLDLFRAGAWIPFSTVPNVHPPGMMAYLALFWSIFGYSIVATRIAMLLVAAFGAVVTFLVAIELARGATGTPAFAALALLCLSPLFFAQAMLAQLDMPAMCLSSLALLLFLQNRLRACAVVCTILVLVKETGIVVPALFGCWVLVEQRGRKRLQALWFLVPLPGLAIWLLALHHATGHWLGSAAFTAYNLREPLHPVRFLLALVRRLYYLFIGTGHFIGTLAVIWAVRRMPLLKDRPWRIAGAFVLAQVLVVSALGGAVLERYLLPALPVVYIAFATSLQALLPRTRQLALAALVICLFAANFVNPLYPFPFENNLSFASFIALEQNAAEMVEQHAKALPGGGVIATAFPIADALRNPEFGYVKTARKVIEINDFSRGEVEKLREKNPDMVVVYQRAWDPLHVLTNPAIGDFLARHYGYEPELRPDQVARALSMRQTMRWTHRGLSIELLERLPLASRVNVTHVNVANGLENE